MLDKTTQLKESAQRSTKAPLSSLHRHDFQIAVVNAILEASPDGILVVSDDRKIVSVNQRFFEIWGLPFANEQGQQSIKPDCEDDQPLLEQVTLRVKDPVEFVERIIKLYDDPSLDDHAEIALKDDRTLDRHSTALYGDQSQYLGRVWFFRDITRHKQEASNLIELAHTDPLTGIANRRYFQKKSHEEFNHARRLKHPLSLILCDIDNFKGINDQFGHTAGDLILQSLCSHFASVVRDVDVMGRLGGDEFVVLLPGTDLTGARITAGRLRAGVEQLEISFGHSKLRFTISSGVSSMSKKNTSIKKMLKQADDALYRAKEKEETGLKWMDNLASPTDNDNLVYLVARQSCS